MAPDPQSTRQYLPEMAQALRLEGYYRHPKTLRDEDVFGGQQPNPNRSATQQNSDYTNGGRDGYQSYGQQATADGRNPSSYSPYLAPSTFNGSTPTGREYHAAHGPQSNHADNPGTLGQAFDPRNGLHNPTNSPGTNYWYSIERSQRQTPRDDPYHAIGGVRYRAPNPRASHDTRRAYDHHGSSGSDTANTTHLGN